MEIFTPTYDYVDSRLTEFLNGRLSDVIAVVEGPLRLALVLYVVLYGFAIWRGSISEPVMDFAIRTIKLVFIYAVATTPAYSEYVTAPLFNGLPNTIASAISGADAPSIGGAFDEFMNAALDLAESVKREGSVVDPAPFFVFILLVAVAGVTAAIGFGITLVAKVALALLVALGPIFVACLVFEPTRRYFFGWLNQAVNYLILFGLIITIFQLIINLVESQWGAISGQPDPILGAFTFMGFCFLGAIFFLQTPNIASGIAGGASAGVGDFANAARSYMNAPRAQASSGSKASRSGGGSIRHTRPSTPTTGGGSAPRRPGAGSQRRRRGAA